MPTDDRPDGDRGVDFVVGAPEPDDDTGPPPGLRLRLPRSLAQRVTLAAGAIVLIVLGLISRGFARDHAKDLADATPTPTATLGTGAATVPDSPAGCHYRLRSTTVQSLPDRVVTALRTALPGVDVQTSTSQLGTATAGPCVLLREINASVHGVAMQIEVRPAASGDHTDYASGAGSSGVDFYVDNVARGYTVHISATQPYGASGTSALTTQTLRRLAADPRLVAA